MVSHAFEMPYDLRMLAERNVDQVRAAYTQILDTATQALSIWLNSFPENDMTSRLKAINQQAMGFARQNVEAAFTFASSLASATDLPDILAKHSRYAQTQMHNYDRQAQELGRLMVGTENPERRI